MHGVLRPAPLLGAFWLVLSGHYSPLFLGLGMLSVALVCWISLRTDVTGIPLRLALRLPRYLFWLGKETLLSSLGVVRRVWSPGLTLQPAMGITPSRNMSVLSQVIYANSITFTPGTLSLTVDDEGIEVHALRAADIADLDAGEMLSRIRHLEPSG